VAAVEASDDVTRTVLEDTVPRLHAAADRLVDVALEREKAAQTVGELRDKSGSEAGARDEDLRRLETRVREADADISATSGEFLDLRARVVRISIDRDNAQRVAALNASLDELNARLEALGDITPSS
jgi:chorismate mutase